MKKYISLLALALVFGVMTSCDSDPSDTDTNPGGTAVKKMCGDWIVTAYTCENQGDVANIDNWEWEELGLKLPAHLQHGRKQVDRNVG